PYGPKPAQFQARVSWDGGPPQGWVTFTPDASDPAGQTYYLPIRSTDPRGGTGAHPFTLEVQASYAFGGLNRHAPQPSVEVADVANSPFGAGWSLSVQDRLAIMPNGDAVLVRGTGGEGRLYRSLGGGQFATPAGEFGTLSFDGSNYVLTNPQQVKRTF